MTPNTLLYATCPRGIAPLLASELASLGASNVRAAGAGVQFSGGFPIAYSACLWSRLANRILLPIHTGVADTPDDLYATVREVDWTEHLQVSDTLAVDAFVANSAITHSQYAALRVKDAIVDQFRDALQQRPDVDTVHPSVRINAYIFRNKLRLAIDLSGEGLHRRGYRQNAGPAPLKENLAAAILQLMQWPQACADGKALLDPMCGSGTLLIEAALMARDIPPGFRREYYGFLGWAGHDASAWADVQAAAEHRINKASTRELPPILGADKDPAALGAAVANASAAGVDGDITLHRQSIERAIPNKPNNPGLLLTNPPYGVRVPDERFIGCFTASGVSIPAATEFYVVSAKWRH